MQSARPDKNLSCPLCPRIFTCKTLLVQHRQMVHFEKQFACETCGRAFRFRSNLREHWSVHTGKKPHVCIFCGKTWRLKGNLKKHIRVHHCEQTIAAVEKDSFGSIPEPYDKSENGSDTSNQLDLNGNGYIIEQFLLNSWFSSNLLTSATNTTHIENDELSQGAEIVGFTDQDRSILISLALDCSKPSESSVSPELEISNNENYPCKICGKVFRHRSNLSDHRTIHTGEKPFACKYCGKMFRLKGNLTKHIKRYHKTANEQVEKTDIIVMKKYDPTPAFSENTGNEYDATIDLPNIQKYHSIESILDDSSSEVLSTSTEEEPRKDQEERVVIVSLGVDYNDSIDLRESNASPNEDCRLHNQVPANWLL